MLSSVEEMKSPQVLYNVKNETFEAKCEDGFLDTYFVFPPMLKEGDKLPCLMIYFRDESEAFQFVGQFNSTTENLEFLFDGPTGYSYKLSISLDPGSENPYIWKAKKHGLTTNYSAFEDAVIYVPKYICLEQSSLVGARKDVMEKPTFYGQSVPEVFCTLRLKIGVVPGSHYYLEDETEDGGGGAGAGATGGAGGRGPAPDDYETFHLDYRKGDDVTEGVEEPEFDLGGQSMGTAGGGDGGTKDDVEEKTLVIDRIYEVTVTLNSEGKPERKAKRSEKVQVFNTLPATGDATYPKDGDETAAQGTENVATTSTKNKDTSRSPKEDSADSPKEEQENKLEEVSGKKCVLEEDSDQNSEKSDEGSREDKSDESSDDEDSKSDLSSEVSKSDVPASSEVKQGGGQSSRARDAKSSASSKSKDLKSSADSKVKDGKSSASSKAKDLKSSASSKAKDLKSSASSKVKDLKASASTKAKAVKSSASTKAKAVKSSASSKAKDVKSSASSKAKDLKSSASSKAKDAKSSGSSSKVKEDSKSDGSSVASSQEDESKSEGGFEDRAGRPKAFGENIHIQLDELRKKVKRDGRSGKSVAQETQAKEESKDDDDEQSENEEGTGMGKSVQNSQKSLTSKVKGESGKQSSKEESPSSRKNDKTEATKTRQSLLGKVSDGQSKKSGQPSLLSKDSKSVASVSRRASKATKKDSNEMKPIPESKSEEDLGPSSAQEPDDENIHIQMDMLRRKQKEGGNKVLSEIEQSDGSMGEANKLNGTEKRSKPSRKTGTGAKSNSSPEGEIVEGSAIGEKEDQNQAEKSDITSKKSTQQKSRDMKSSKTSRPSQSNTHSARKSTKNTVTKSTNGSVGEQAKDENIHIQLDELKKGRNKPN